MCEGQSPGHTAHLQILLLTLPGCRPVSRIFPQDPAVWEAEGPRPNAVTTQAAIPLPLTQRCCLSAHLGPCRREPAAPLSPGQFPGSPRDQAVERART